MRIKKGDQVKILSGKDRGKKGKVLRTLPEAGKIMVEGLNLIKKHNRPRRQGEKGQRTEVPAPINASNALVICTHCGKTTRVGYRETADRKVRICKKCQSEI